MLLTPNQVRDLRAAVYRAQWRVKGPRVTVLYRGGPLDGIRAASQDWGKAERIGWALSTPKGPAGSMYRHVEGEFYAFAGIDPPLGGWPGHMAQPPATGPDERFRAGPTA